ncbi:MAG TPA: hypothetical protein PK231_09015 [Acidocella sp.]|nr:MAG: hypothetical protein B7Z77_05815 [Acidocella sp. 20-58-15]HQT39554.1 hypothetical protein [Acidocella sp.]
MDILKDHNGQQVWLHVVNNQTFGLWIGPSAPYYGLGNTPASGYFWVPLPEQPATQISQFGAVYSDWINLDLPNSQLQFGKSITVTSESTPDPTAIPTADGKMIYFIYYATL